MCTLAFNILIYSCLHAGITQVIRSAPFLFSTGTVLQSNEANVVVPWWQLRPLIESWQHACKSDAGLLNLFLLSQHGALLPKGVAAAGRKAVAIYNRENKYEVSCCMKPCLQRPTVGICRLMLPCDQDNTLQTNVVPPAGAMGQSHPSM